MLVGHQSLRAGSRPRTLSTKYPETPPTPFSRGPIDYFPSQNVNHDFAVGNGERYFPAKLTRFVMNIAPVYKFAVVGCFSRTRSAFRDILQHFSNEKALLSLSTKIFS